MLQWNELHPYNAVHVLRLPGSIDLERLCRVVRAVVEPGDTVVYPVPSWNNNHYVHMCGARGIPVVCSPEDAFLPTPAALLTGLCGLAQAILDAASSGRSVEAAQEALRTHGLVFGLTFGENGPEGQVTEGWNEKKR